MTANKILSFAENATTSTGTVTITAVNNAVNAADKTVTVSGTASINTVTAPSDVTLTITDDDDLAVDVVVEVVDSVGGSEVVVTSVAEDTGTATVRVTATTNGSEVPTTIISFSVFSRTTGHTATNNVDFTALSQSISIAPAEFTLVAGEQHYAAVKTLTLTIANDVVDEEDETFELRAARAPDTPTYVTLPADLEITITDDDEVPGAPTNLAAEAGDAQVVLTWAAPTAAGTSTITGYQYSYAPSGDSFSAWVSVGMALTATVTGLTNGTAHEFLVRAVSAAGAGAAASQDATPQAATASPAVTLVLTPSSIGENGGTSTVTATVSPASATAFTITVATDPATSDDFTVTSNKTLSFGANAASSTGTVTITAVNNDVDAADKTVTVSGTASINTVTAPSDVTLTITDDDGVGVTITPTTLTVTEGDATGVGYTVKLDTEPTATVTVTPTVPSGTDVSVTPTSLTFTTGNWNTAQTVTVKAAEDDDKDADPAVTITHGASGGDYGSVSVPSVVVTITDDDTTAPEQVTGLTATANDARTGVVLAWTTPADGGSAITKHQYQRKGRTGNYGSWNDIADSAAGEDNVAGFTVTGLTNSRNYRFKVRAVNAVGNGDASDEASAATVPEAGTLSLATPFSGRVLLSYTSPSNPRDGGSRIIRINARYKKTADENFSGWDSFVSGIKVYNNLENGVEYTFEARAVNAIGAGAVSSGTATPVGVPDQITDLTATADVANSQVALAWTTPGDNGSAITKHQYTQRGSDDITSAWTDIPMSAAGETNVAGYTVTGLTSPKTYHFHVRAVNANGEGPRSTEALRRRFRASPQA